MPATRALARMVFDGPIRDIDANFEDGIPVYMKRVRTPAGLTRKVPAK
jgi:regulator of RNase E activity RraA